MNVSLLIAEDRARCTDSMLACRRPSNELIVLSQHAGESRREFRRRVTERLARFRRREMRLDQVTLVVGAERDAGALLARAQMLGLLLAELGADARIVLDAGSDADPGARQTLRAMVETMVSLAPTASGTERLLTSARATP